MNNMHQIRVLLADDHLVVRMGLAAIISFEDDLVLAGEASDGAEAVSKALKLRPDVIVMDLMMPQVNGVEATRKIRAKWPDAKIMILTSFGSSDDIKKVVDAGAQSAIVKDSSQEYLLAAIRDTYSGNSVFSPDIAITLRSSDLKPNISDRQREILTCVAKGFTNKEIARILNIGNETVKQHMSTILLRLHASSRAEAAAQALSLGLITA